MGDADGEVEPNTEPPKEAAGFFEPLPWNISSAEDMREILDFGHRKRPTAFAKELLVLPCMRPAASPSPRLSRSVV